MNENRNSFPKYVGQNNSSFKTKIIAGRVTYRNKKIQINELYILVHFFCREQ